MRQYRAICFDLDGTILPMDLDEFMKRYFGSIAMFAAAHGIDLEKFLAGLKAGTKAMALHEDEATNAEAFWSTMFTYVDENEVDWDTLFASFYEDEFGKIGHDAGQSEPMVRALDMLAAKGYPLVLTTMPMFPPRAVQWRVSWAGVDPSCFARITTYDNSTSVKPKLTYYAENLAAMGLRGEDVLMVGNNTVEDYAFADLGADVYIVTDWLLGPSGFDLNAVKHGTAEEFAAWVEALPACANPALDINPGVVSNEDMERALAENAIVVVDRAEAALKAARAIEDPLYREERD